MNKTILVIEDEYEIRKDLLKTLELSNYNAIGAINGTIGMELALKYKPDLIISDIMMPDIDGYELLKELQSKPETNSIPFLFLTAKSDKTDIRTGMNLGADDYITKPYDIDELLEAIEIRLKKRQRSEKEYLKKFEELSSSINRSLPHEIRTPLSLILGYSDYLLKKIDSFNKDEAKEMLQNIYEAGKRLYHLFENYLFYANLQNISSSPYELKKLQSKKTFSAMLIIRDIVIYYSDKSERKQDIKLDLEDAVVRIAEDFLVKITEEIIDNCLKFSNAGRPIEITSKIENNSYYVSFKDYGRGMTQDQINNLGAYIQFERKIYEQQGAGLGIAIVKKIVEIHNGEIKFDSIINEFTKVIIKLPIYED